MSRKYVSRDKFLESPKNDSKLIATSEIFSNVWFEIKGRAMSVNATVNNRVITLPGTMADMRLLAKELNEIIDVYGDL